MILQTDVKNAQTHANHDNGILKKKRQALYWSTSKPIYGGWLILLSQFLKRNFFFSSLRANVAPSHSYWMTNFTKQGNRKKRERKKENTHTLKTGHKVPLQEWEDGSGWYDSSILLLPELMMRFCKVALTLKSVDQIQSCDHSNETSLVVCSHGAICFSKFCKMKFGNFRWIFAFGHIWHWKG